jgi:tRNA (guanine37-N1)-methyltransferase
MVQAPGVRVPRGDAEATRRRLQEMDVLRRDLEVGRDGDHVVFPVVEACGPRLPTVPWEFLPRELRPESYADLLGWPADLRGLAPRAYDQMGDIIIVKVPEELRSRAADLGSALLRFHKARAVFHDDGVTGPFRLRQLSLIAGSGTPETTVSENGLRFHIDPSQAYFSPRLATERAREAALVQPGEHVVDLFGGVAPFAVQAARRGATVDCVDLNPAAIALARKNADEAKVSDRVAFHVGDARLVAATLAPADRIAMNLPHAAKDFLDVAAQLAKPGATVHYHEMLPPARADERGRELVHRFDKLGRRVEVGASRVVRNYSPQDAHIVFDLKVAA